jgi:hypothetical protein
MAFVIGREASACASKDMDGHHVGKVEPNGELSLCWLDRGVACDVRDFLPWLYED